MKTPLSLSVCLSFCLNILANYSDSMCKLQTQTRPCLQTRKHGSCCQKRWPQTVKKPLVTTSELSTLNRKRLPVHSRRCFLPVRPVPVPQVITRLSARRAPPGLAELRFSFVSESLIPETVWQHLLHEQDYRWVAVPPLILLDHLCRKLPLSSNLFGKSLA